MSERMLRLCDVCSGLDDHPRHVAHLSAGEVDPVDAQFLDALPEGVPYAAIAELVDPTSTVRHLDCCAAAGCQSCAQDLAATGDLRGAELLKALQAR